MDYKNFKLIIAAIEEEKKKKMEQQREEQKNGDEIVIDISINSSSPPLFHSIFGKRKAVFQATHRECGTCRYLLSPNPSTVYCGSQIAH